MKRTTLAIFATLLTMASTSFAATQAANAATVAPTLQISATIQKAVSLTLATGATGGISHCTVTPNGGAPDYKMDFGTVDALGINNGNCNKFAPVKPGTTNAIYWTDFQVTPVFTSHQTFGASTVTAYVSTDFAAPNNLAIVDTGVAAAVPAGAGSFALMSTAAATPDSIGASGVVSGTALTRFIGVAVKPLNSASTSYASQSATVTFTLTVQ